MKLAIYGVNKYSNQICEWQPWENPEKSTCIQVQHQRTHKIKIFALDISFTVVSEQNPSFNNDSSDSSSNDR